MLETPRKPIDGIKVVKIIEVEQDEKRFGNYYFTVVFATFLFSQISADLETREFINLAEKKCFNLTETRMFIFFQSREKYKFANKVKQKIHEIKNLRI